LISTSDGGRFVDLGRAPCEQTDDAWDVPGTEKGLEPDKGRKPEIVWKELVDQRLDMSEVNKRWLDEYKKKYNLK
jgi:hypothetical protein